MTKAVDPSTLDLEGLKALALSLKIDSMGTLNVLKDRVIRQLKANGTWNPTDKKKRSKKKVKHLERVELKESETDANSNDVIIEIVPEKLLIDGDMGQQFTDLLDRFKERTLRRIDQDEDQVVLNTTVPDEEDDEENQLDPQQVIQSKKKLKKASRLTVAQLKQLVSKPEVWVDVTSSDPLLLVTLKSTRNTIPVPGHWSKKSAYLSGKRGFEKPPFELPEYIKATGIMQLRQTSRGNHSIQAKARERAHPKLGRLDIDYQKLHDAFFRFQTKPVFSVHGDVYFEGREFESGLRMRKPGVLSDDLKIALNIPPGAPPPWLINMQRYGPPPSYPQLQIPGLNAPIAEGAQWGFHPGGWGKPPTDEYNRPLYGDVFASVKSTIPEEFVAAIEATLWGELEEEEEFEDESEEDEEEEAEEVAEVAEQEEVHESVQFETGVVDIETDHIELRKEARRPAPSETKSLFTVLPQAKADSSKGFLGSTHTYQIPPSSRSDKLGLAPKSVEVALNPDDLEDGVGMDAETMKRKFEEGVQKAKKGVEREDLSEMVGEHVEKQAKRTRRDDGRKGKDFKF